MCVRLGTWTVARYWLAIMWCQIWIRKHCDQKPFGSDRVPSKAKGLLISDELCFPFLSEGDFLGLLIKALLIGKVQWAVCQNTQTQPCCLRFDRCLLVFHPGSLNMHGEVERKIAKDARLLVGCFVVFTRKLNGSFSFIKGKQTRNSHCIGFLEHGDVKQFRTTCTLKHLKRTFYSRLPG